MGQAFLEAADLTKVFVIANESDYRLTF